VPAVANTCRHRDERSAAQAAQDRGQRGLHSGDRDHDVRAGDPVLLGQQPVQTGDTHIDDHVRLCAEDRHGGRTLPQHRQIGGSRADHGNPAAPGIRGTEHSKPADIVHPDAGQLLAAADLRLRGQASGHHRTLGMSFVQRPQRRHYLLGSFTSAENHLRVTGTNRPLYVQPGEPEIDDLGAGRGRVRFGHLLPNIQSEWHVDTTSLADQLVAELAGYGRTLVAFSGGVDSSVVLAAAVRGLGAQHVAAITAVSPALPAAERAAAAEFCAQLGVVHHTPATREMEQSGYRENGPRRCYFCKSTLLDAAGELALAYGFPTVATGTNASDLAAGFRPGIRAAGERGARTPLADLGLDKAAVRSIAREWELATWNKPAAACLSSRIAYGVEISPARLGRVERAEAAARLLLADHQVRNLRVRDLGDAVRLEVDQAVVAHVREHAALHEAIRAAGFGNLPVTVEPFRSGSMNALLSDAEQWRQV